MKPIAHINAKFVAPVMQFAAVKDVRHYLEGMHIKPAADGGVLVMATDGHTAIIARDPNGWCREPMTIRPDGRLKQAARQKKAKTLMVYPGGVGLVRDYTAERFLTMAGALGNARAVGKVDLVDAIQYPDIRSIFPDEFPSDATSFSINPDYVARFSKCFGEMQGKTNKYSNGVVAAVQTEGREAVLFLPAYGDIEAAGLVMQMRVSNDDPVYSKGWMKPAVKKRMRADPDGELVPVDQPQE